MALPEWVRAGAIRSDGEVQEAVHRRLQGIVGTDLHEALAISRRQQATFWKLRAAMSLSRLWQRQGKRQAVHQLLAEVYGGFTEGLDTADVRKAKVLLDELEA
jgi:predicted ATPase